MTVPPDDTPTDLHAVIAALRVERDAALSEKAMVAEELAARTADLQESLEYQTATSDVLKVISRSTFDLQPVLDTLIVSALGLCNASQGEIWRKDGEVFRHAASHGNLPAYREIEERTEIGAGRGTLVGRVALRTRAGSHHRRLERPRIRAEGGGVSRSVAFDAWRSIATRWGVDRCLRVGPD